MKIKKYRVGVDVGGTKTAYALFDEDFSIVKIKVEKSRSDLSSVEMIELIAKHINQLLSDAKITTQELRGVGFDFPAHILYKTGTIITSSNLPNWKNVCISEILEEKLGTKVFVDNDANAACLAEAKLGAGKDHKNLIYVTISTGIGGGLFLNGEMYRGSFGAAGEIGHIPIGSNSGIVCGCGNMDCAETIASGTAMTKYAKMLIVQGNKTIIEEIAGGFENITPHHIAIAHEKGDKIATQVLDYAADGLGRLFNGLYQAFNVDLLIYGGGVTKIGEPLMSRVYERFIAHCPMAKQYPMQLVCAKLGDNVNVIGAALLVE